MKGLRARGTAQGDSSDNPRNLSLPSFYRRVWGSPERSYTRINPKKALLGPLVRAPRSSLVAFEVVAAEYTVSLAHGMACILDNLLTQMHFHST
jgi:hypothetical protein